ncbi:hypothetical protein SAMN02799631_01770 [Methylobacterium sp. 174MFSha1.1]|uniref:hypothetical protein n=1 Tax=Methylobacterium sp. 174MFSha1.1 TaxID=1502749 RepID=UPI0008DF4AA6|nr:hypothetical protein [Methylobacterium sp. 174MFSha1.1]SFU67799.1 hypothetical protein SAMN02799631_01770 [Methylobacterium sp. 174MFSha1.1]
MRTALALTLLALTAAIPAAAQPAPKAPPKAPPPQREAPQPDPAAAMLFPCRTPEETCYVGVVKGGKVTVLFTNDRKADEIAGKPMAVAGDGLDLAKTENRTVMLVGTYDPKDGLTKAELVDVASPLVAFALKSTIGGGEADEGGDEPPAPPPPAPRKK